MTYFQQLKEFRATYKVKNKDFLKLAMLYPVFKCHFWLQGSKPKRFIAKTVFKILPSKNCFMISLNFPTLKHPLPVPVWLRPDRLSSFREIFWTHAYRPKLDWKPSLFIDAGANAGYASLYVAGHSYLRNILAIEANPDFNEALKWTAEILAKQGVDMRLAMGAVVGIPRELILEVNESDRDSKVFDKNAVSKTKRRTFTVKGQKISSWLKDSGLGDLARSASILLKADIEGSEHEMLCEEPDLINSLDYIVMEIHGDHTLRDKLVLQISAVHRILERISSPSYPDVEILFSEHQRLKRGVN